MIFQESFEPTSETALDDFALKRGIVLPREYRAFLLKHNGGYAPNDAYIHVENWNSTTIHTMLGLVDNESESISDQRLGNFSKALRRQFLQIAFDSGSHMFVMDLRAKNYGKIYIRDHNTLPKLVPVVDGFGFDKYDYEEATLYHHIADRFTGFLAMLGPDPLDE